MNQIPQQQQPLDYWQLWAKQTTEEITANAEAIERTRERFRKFETVLLPEALERMGKRILALESNAISPERREGLIARLHALETETVPDIRMDIREIKTKIAMWTVIGGFVGSIAGSVITALIISLLSR